MFANLIEDLFEVLVPIGTADADFVGGPTVAAGCLKQELSLLL